MNHDNGRKKRNIPGECTVRRVCPGYLRVRARVCVCVCARVRMCLRQWISMRWEKRGLLRTVQGHESVQGGGSPRGRRQNVPGPEEQAERKPAAAVAGGAPAPNDAVNLERRVGLISGVALIVGTMIGELCYPPPPLFPPFPPFFCNMHKPTPPTLGALCYVELGCMIPSSGAEHTYFMTAFGHLPAFLFAWVSIIILKPAMLAIICLSFSKYLVEAFASDCEPPLTAIQLLGALTIVLITFINSYSVTLATKVQNIFTAAKLLAILIIVVGGAVRLIQGNTQYLATGFQGSTASFGDIATAFYSGLWAYDGWNNLNYVTEELKKPYTLIDSRQEITPEPHVLNTLIDSLTDHDSTFGNRVLGWAAFLMPLAVTLSTFGAANGTAFTSGRLCFVAAREGHMVDVLSYVHAKKLTPSPALLFNAFIALMMVIPSDIGSLIDFFSFTAWIFYGGAMLALIIMRRTMKDVPRPYKVPIVIPVIVLVISIYLVVGPIIDSPQIEYLYASLFILAGLVFYFPFVYFKKSVPGMGHLTTFFQLILQVVPTDTMPDA
ncbi:b(0,+)-type amino acid transporter 1-like [Penaeus monodon]|uniref:b(0,+)-type amino acid transporter 1-like n=1 Tax=Penaeus monodon TaxID=6687 RepID=UPI0018A78AA7|nr:b(0,+)-type amino acid transporter 1-like [Penaeus monodon]